MNILIPDSWLREYLVTPAAPSDIGRCLSLCGPSVEKITPYSPPPKLGGRNKEGGQVKNTNLNAPDTEDYIYDIEVTTNRADCMSVYGIAREAAAILPQFGFPARLKPLPLTSLNAGRIPGLSVTLNPELCHRIMAVSVSGISVGPSPRWLADRLTAVGQRPLNNLVDITNYVMWETGHPTHVFDLDRLTAKTMIVRQAKAGETITTLDHKTYTMTGHEVVIDDGTGKIIDLPSIMGTANSVVTGTTSTALFFVDDVKSSLVRKASMTHAIRTQAATLLEKNISPETSVTAISRLVYLIKQLFPHAVISPLLDIYPRPPRPVSVSLAPADISRLAGQPIGLPRIKSILRSLGFAVTGSASRITVTPPPWRMTDISIPEDITEEVIRIFGYHNIPPVLMATALPASAPDPVFYWESRIRTALKYLGFNEVYTYSLVSSGSGLKLANPLSADWTYLRTNLAPSHAAVITANIGKADRLDLFEIAAVYLPQSGRLPQEETRLILSASDSDYSAFKGKIEALLSDLGISGLVPDISVASGCLYWEIPTASLISRATDRKSYTPISKYAPVIEDVNLPHRGSYAAIVSGLHRISPLIKSVVLVEKYGDKLTLRLTFHSDTRQLSSADVAPLRERIMSAFGV